MLRRRYTKQSCDAQGYAFSAEVSCLSALELNNHRNLKFGWVWPRRCMLSSIWPIEQHLNSVMPRKAGFTACVLKQTLAPLHPMNTRGAHVLSHAFTTSSGINQSNDPTVVARAMVHPPTPACFKGAGVQRTWLANKMPT